MKVIAVILSIYVYSLASAPILGLIDLFPESMCCQEVCLDEDGEHEEGEDKNCKETCNPFLSCQCTIGFEITEIENFPTLPSSEHSQNGLLQTIKTSQVVFLIWHPPQSPLFS